MHLKHETSYTAIGSITTNSKFPIFVASLTCWLLSYYSLTNVSALVAVLLNLFSIIPVVMRDQNLRSDVKFKINSGAAENLSNFNCFLFAKF